MSKARLRRRLIKAARYDNRFTTPMLSVDRHTSLLPSGNRLYRRLADMGAAGMSYALPWVPWR